MLQQGVYHTRIHDTLLSQMKLAARTGMKNITGPANQGAVKQPAGRLTDSSRYSSCPSKFNDLFWCGKTQETTWKTRTIFCLVVPHDWLLQLSQSLHLKKWIPFENEKVKSSFLWLCESGKGSLLTLMSSQKKKTTATNTPFNLFKPTVRVYVQIHTWPKLKIMCRDRLLPLQAVSWAN